MRENITQARSEARSVQIGRLGKRYLCRMERKHQRMAMDNYHRPRNRAALIPLLDKHIKISVDCIY